MSTIVGDNSKPTIAQQRVGNTKQQVATLLTMPVAGTVFSIGFWARGISGHGNIDISATIWHRGATSSSGNTVWEVALPITTNAAAVDPDNLVKFTVSISPIDVAAGDLMYVGIAADTASGSAHQWGKRATGTMYSKDLAAGGAWPVNMNHLDTEAGAPAVWVLMDASLEIVGSGGVEFNRPTLAGVAKLKMLATGAYVIHHPVLAGVARAGIKGQGTVAFARPALVGVAAQKITIAASGGVTFARPALAGVGKGLTLGAGAITFAHPSLAGIATAVKAVTGDGAITFTHPSLAGVGVGRFTGAGAIAFGHPALAGVAIEKVIHTATGAIRFVRPTLHGVGIRRGSKIVRYVVELNRRLTDSADPLWRSPIWRKVGAPPSFAEQQGGAIDFAYDGPEVPAGQYTLRYMVVNQHGDESVWAYDNTVNVTVGSGEGII